MLKRISKTRQLEDFGIDKVLDWAKKSKVMRGFFVAAVPILGGCAKPPAVEEAPLPSADETATPLIEVAPTETLALTATLAPTETENPFEGLSICRTWREAANCPITENDFRRISDYVKANYKFSPEALKVNWVKAFFREKYTSHILIHAMTYEEIISGTGVGAEYDVPGKINIFESTLSPIGESYYFWLKKNPPAINYNNLVAVFPVNNADSSLGTYTIIVPPFITPGDFGSPEERTEVNYARKFDKMPYLPPVYNMGPVPESTYRPGQQGDFINKIFQETNDLDGERIKLFREWEETGVIPEKLEKLPLFGSDLALSGRNQNTLD
jgi:hypothetical protein